MITIAKNKNFSNWFDVRVMGKLVDNAKSQVKALEIARSLRRTEKRKGNVLAIKTLLG